MTVLLVDDEDGYRMLVRDILMEEGLDVVTACNGEEALERLA